MRTPSTVIAILTLAATAAGALLTGGSSLAQSRPKFYSDDPISREPETQDASKAQEWEIGLLSDLVLNLFTKPGDLTLAVRAQNINTIDEVPDSSWFTNRIYAKPVSLEDLARGPNTTNGPAKGRWTIVRAKAAGAAPGFTARDEQGDTWFVSFDGKGHPVAATAALAVATRLFWALGYNQVENHLTTLRAEDVVIGDGVTINAHGKRRRMTTQDLAEVFDRSARLDDGTYRVIAGRAVPGKVLGGFKYYGTRPDDPNDVVAHEHRRELRALQVFGAWTNLVDLKAGNTLDTIITENGRGVVRHYLQDVGSTFGTGATEPRDVDEGYEYVYEGSPTFKRLVSLGLYIEPWQVARYERNAEVGRFEAETFDPETWKTRVPAAALQHARPDDTLWAALRVMAFTDEQIRAAVKTGQYLDPAADTLLADTLIARRDKIGRAYFVKVNPLTRFALDGAGTLTFENPAVLAKLAEAPAGGYTADWSSFDNTTRDAKPVGTSRTGAGATLSAPAGLPTAAGAFIKVSVGAGDAAHASWKVPVDVYFRRAAAGWTLVGVERLPDVPPGSVKPAAAPKAAPKGY